MRWVACADRVHWVDAGLEVSEVPGWCRDPAVPAEDDLGLIGCAEDLDRHLLERRLRVAGFDPLAVPLVLLTDLDRSSADRMRTRVAAASARAGAYRGSRPEHLKPVMPAAVSRRSFLSFRSPVYRTVPRPDAGLCRAGDGCRACVEVCPHGALRWADGRIDHDRLSCEGCGRCVTACPVGAMVNPAFTAAQLTAEVSAYAPASPDSFGIVFHCSRAAVPAMGSGWYGLKVPCVGMLPPHWILTPLVKGSAAVTVAPCGCGMEDDVVERVRSAVRAARSWWQASGHDDAEDRIQDEMGALPLEPAGIGSVESGFDPAGALALADVLGPVLWENELASAGLVTIAGDLCTGCEMCATVCPTAALTSSTGDGWLAILFDPAACTACGQCTQRCPEIGAISMRRLVDTFAISRGPVELVRHQVARCAKCGGSVAPRAALDRIAALLDDEVLLTQLSSVCVDCRGTTMVF